MDELTKLMQTKAEPTSIKINQNEIYALASNKTIKNYKLRTELKPNKNQN